MRYIDSPDETRFRGEVRSWLNVLLPTLGPRPSPENWQARRVYDAAWQRAQYDAGFAGIDWPREFGGRGGTPIEQLIFVEECSRARAPYGAANFVGVKHAGPTIFTEGSKEQRQRYLAPILRGEEIWCQGFSEPGAGSDLAAVRTRAVRQGDHYVLNGQKIWTSHAQVADQCEMIVRTGEEGDRHRGLTFLIVPMDLPGIEIRPLRTVLGSEEFAEVFLSDVRVPVANRVGAEGAGWKVAMTTLGFERGTVFIPELVDAQVLVSDLQALCTKRRSEDTALSNELAGYADELEALWALIVRSVSGATPGQAPGLMGSLFKLRFTELFQEITQTAAEVLGTASILLTDVDDRPVRHWGEERLRALSLTLAGGTSQIQRNIIAERMLGLPRG